MYAELYMPDPTSPATIKGLKSARLEQPFPVDLCDMRHPHRRPVIGTCTLRKEGSDYRFFFAAKDSKRGEIHYSLYRELVMEWINEKEGTP